MPSWAPLIPFEPKSLQDTAALSTPFGAFLHLVPTLPKRSPNGLSRCTLQLLIHGRHAQKRLLKLNFANLRFLRFSAVLALKAL